MFNNSRDYDSNRTYKNLNDLYLNELSNIYINNEYENSPRGCCEFENIGFFSKILNPHHRYCLNKTRKQNIIFNYAESLWYLSGGNDLDFIAYYAPSITKYSMDGHTLPGTGYGKKLFNFGEKKINQIERAVDILSNDDADSKRVFLQIFDANENLYKNNLDVSCTIGLQLLLRKNKLHMIAMMRANDAYVGMLGDIFSFTFIQEFIAKLIGCELGHYYHMVGSIHIYKNNLEKIKTILKNSNKIITIYESYPTIPHGTDLSIIDKVLEIEKEIRINKKIFSDTDINKYKIHPYWQEIVRLFNIFTLIKLDERIYYKDFEKLNEINKKLILNKWPDKFLYNLGNNK